MFAPVSQWHSAPNAYADRYDSHAEHEVSFQLHAHHNASSAPPPFMLLSAHVLLLARHDGLMDLKFMRPQLLLDAAPHRAQLASLEIPSSFDARSAFPMCGKTIGFIRNQGHCGSCWAFGAVETLADRICIASKGADNFRLSAQSLIDCDKADNGCEGGYLDSAWQGLVSRGALTDACDPYKHCDYPPFANCTKMADEYLSLGPAAPVHCPTHCPDGGAVQWHKASSAYAVSEPGDVATMQRELIAHGPFEVAFFVFSDFYTCAISRDLPHDAWPVNDSTHGFHIHTSRQVYWRCVLQESERAGSDGWPRSQGAWVGRRWRRALLARGQQLVGRLG